MGIPEFEARKYEGKVNRIHRIEEPNMASLAEQHNRFRVSEARRRCGRKPREPATKNALQHFQEYWRKRPLQSWRCPVLRHWLRTRLEIQAVVNIESP